MPINVLEQSSEKSLSSVYSGSLTIGSSGSPIVTLTEVSLGALMGVLARFFNDSAADDMFFRFGPAGQTGLISAQMFRVRPSGASDLVSIPNGAESVYIIGTGSGVWGSANIYHGAIK